MPEKKLHIGMHAQSKNILIFSDYKIRSKEFIMSTLTRYSVLTDSIKFRIEETSPNNDIVVNSELNNFGELMSEFEQLSNEFQNQNSSFQLKDDSNDID